jgi:hypothetical protein
LEMVNEGWSCEATKTKITVPAPGEKVPLVPVVPMPIPVVPDVGKVIAIRLYPPTV